MFALVVHSVLEICVLKYEVELHKSRDTKNSCKQKLDAGGTEKLEILLLWPYVRDFKRGSFHLCNNLNMPFTMVINA